jgi:DNA helicase II / ATP-dependent DNA helicase PcrA
MPLSKINKLLIAGAGSGKTTYLIKLALANPNINVLITTYTEENEAEIKKKIIEQKKCIPSNITIQTWFSFLIQHGLKPFQGAVEEELHEQSINGLLLMNSKSGFNYENKMGFKVYFNEATEFKHHYFTSNWYIFSDKLSKLVIKINKAVNNLVIDRITSHFKLVLIDEIQDLAGYDLEIVKFLFKSKSNIYLVGDPRQVTYLTHHESKYKKYVDGKIKDFINSECGKKIKCEIDETTLNNSHRNNSEICTYSSKLYGNQFIPMQPCSCLNCRTEIVNDIGIYIIDPKDVDSYLSKFNPIQLRYNKSRIINENYKSFNFGESKGKTFERVLIYPTGDMEKWVNDNSFNLKNEVRAKFYVAITRAKYSVGIVMSKTKIKNIDVLLECIP